MKTGLITFSIFFVIISSCKKDEKENIETLPYTEVYGKVISTGSNKPVEGVRVSIWDGLPDTGPLSGGSYKGSGEYDTTLTDVNGNFHIGINGKEPVLYLYKKGYTFEYNVEGAVIGIMPLNAGDVYDNIKINLDAIAYYNPVLVNLYPQKGNDTLIIYSYSKHVLPFDVSHYIGNGPFKFYISDKYGYQILGDSYVKFKLEFQRNNSWHTKFDSSYVIQGEIFADTIYY
jgi:hypothetical protein